MPPNSEIEKLERRWKENPKGTVFAPYAEVLRKHGEHDLSREVLRQGLELHPDHIPGNIVLGRCCLDLREDGPAEAAFTHVLELDSENVIALKALADITERQGRLLEASHWLSRLITVDPSNDEARDQFNRVEGAREAAALAITGKISAQGGQPPTPESAVAGADEGSAGAVIEVAAGEINEDVDAALDAAIDAFDTPLPATVEVQQVGRNLAPADAETVPVIPVVRPESRPQSAQEPPAIVPMELDLARMAAETSATPLEGMEPAEAFSPPDRDEAAGSAPPPPHAADLLEVGIEDHSEIELRPSGSGEFQSPDDSSDLLSLSAGKSEFQAPDAAEELTIRSAGGSEFQTPSGAEELLAKASAADPEPEPLELQPPTAWTSAPYTSGYAAVGMSPTEELGTTPPPAPPERPGSPRSPGAGPGRRFRWSHREPTPVPWRKPWLRCPSRSPSRPRT